MRYESVESYNHTQLHLKLSVNTCLMSPLSSSFQVVKEGEDSEKRKSEICSSQHNSDYDDCVIETKHIHLLSQLNCSFSFLAGEQMPMTSTSPNECKLWQLSKKDMEYLKEILTGTNISKMYYSFKINIQITSSNQK